MRINHVLLILLSFAVGIFCGVPGLGAATSGARKYVTIPILYLTDREMKGDCFGSHRRYPTQCEHHMYYGTAYVTVPNEHHLEACDVLDRLGWKFTDTKAAKISTKDMINPDDPEASKAKFFEKLASALDRSGSNDVLLYVHGAADAFEDCGQDAAQMAYSLEEPTVLYSWPSNPKWRGYFVDGSNSEWSQAHFNMFCGDLLAFRAKHPLTVTSISHSMGNRLVIRALPVLFGSGIISNWELVSPDMDADTCRHYAMGFSQSRSKIRLYVSNKDKMLALAQLFAGGYYRLGEAANPTRFQQSGSSVNPLNIERIDFTTMDHGFHGHSIPCDLIASMIKTGSPPAGYVLAPQSSVRANRLIRFANRSQKLSDTSGVPSQFCKIVVRENTKGSAKEK